MGKELNAKQHNAGALSNSALGCLGSTVGSFANRISKGLKEQEQKNDQSTKLRDARHSSMLHAMSTIRKALQETCKIQLGERFGFDLDVSDWEGWPRVELRLIDFIAPELENLSLVVTANDNNELGNIMIGLKSGEQYSKLQLAQPGEVERIPVVLKRSVRLFLDVVGEYVLNPVPEELVEAAARPIETEEFDEVAEKLRKEEMFIEEQYSSHRDNLVSPEDENTSNLLDTLALAAK